MIASTPRTRRLSLSEQGGGWIIAVCAHVVLLAALAIARPPNEPPAEPNFEPIRIVFDQPALEPAPEPVEAADDAQSAAAEPAGEEVDWEAVVEAAMREPEEAAEEVEEPIDEAMVAAFLSQDFLQAVTPEPPPAPEPEPEAEPEPEPVEPEPAVEPVRDLPPVPEPPAPTEPVREEAPVEPELEAELLELVREMRQRSEQMERQNELARRSGSKTVADALGHARTEQVADRTLRRAPGLDRGISRTVDTSNVPNDVADEVLRRYGFDIVVTKLDGTQKLGGGYLSSANTPTGRFVNSAGVGTYRLLLFGDNTVRMLAQLEQAEIERRGVDLEKVRVRQVVFGVVPSGSRYDLGVIRLETEPLAPGFEPPAAPPVERRR